MVAIGAYWQVETRDQLVRLNIGATPIESNISDWALVSGDLLYLLFRSDWAMRYVRVPLDFDMLESIRESFADGADGLYRDSRGEPTQLARFLASFFLDRDVPVTAIRRELDMSEMTMRSLLNVWQCARCRRRCRE
ncbi:hypothetical protein CR51_25920 [Caballeronia megalochromosomata]|jgi:hypothetical protein|nr:hypothetical protein CR51_25920 [Caballeronia megalochromosomata]